MRLRVVICALFLIGIISTNFFAQINPQEEEKSKPGFLTQDKKPPDRLEPQIKPEMIPELLEEYVAVANRGAVTKAAMTLSLGLLLFGIIILGLEITLTLQIAKRWSQSSIRLIGLTLVILAGLFLITAGYSQQQIAPMIGLLGTIAGYLLGKTEASQQGK